MHIAFIINSRIRYFKRLKKEILDTFNNQDVNISLFETRYKGHAIELAEEASGEYQPIIAAGGDGTFSEVVNGVMHWNSANTGEETPVVGLLPAGNANDFAGVNGFSQDLDQLKAMINKQNYQTIDVGEVRNLDTGAHIRYFINIADVGLGAEVVNRIENSRWFTRHLPSDLKFLWAVTRSFFTYKRRNMVLRFNETSWEGEALAVIAANNSTFGSGLVIAPEAKLNDGLLDLVILGKVSIPDYIRNVFRVKRGEKIQHEDVHYLKVESLEIHSSFPQHVEADGEGIGTTPVMIRCHEKALKLMSK